MKEGNRIKERLRERRNCAKQDTMDEAGKWPGCVDHDTVCVMSDNLCYRGGTQASELRILVNTATHPQS